MNHLIDALQWDILSHGLGIQDVVRVSSARNSTDSVSVVSVEVTPSPFVPARIFISIDHIS